MADKKNKNMFLWWGSGSGPCWKVMFALAEKGMWEGCPNKLIEFSKKEHKADDVMKLNPRGQVPTFKDGELVINESTAICMYVEEQYGNQGTSLLPKDVCKRVPTFKDGELVINESTAICMYLEEQYGNQGTSLLPKDACKRAQVYQRVTELSNLEGVIRPIFMYKMRTKAEDQDAAHIKELIGKAEEEIARWNCYLDGKKYLCGDDFSMADIFLYVFTATMNRQSANLSKKYPALAAFHELVSKRAAAIATTPPHWKDSDSPCVLKGLGE